MRLLVHDLCGHPFQVQLSRELARRGHDVLHLHCTSFTTGKGRLAHAPDDPPALRIEGIDLGAPFAKYRFAARMLQERRYGELLVAHAQPFRPQVVVSANAPLRAQARLFDWCGANGIATVHWLQDLIGFAMRRAAHGRLPVLGDLLGRVFVRFERRIVRRASAVVAIAEDFVPVLRAWGIAERAIRVVPNWAPLDELPTRPRHNAWARAHGLGDRTVFVYAGTLGIKHDPGLLADLAQHVAKDGAAVAVVSEGRGADWLARAARTRGLDNLLLLPFQPWEAMPDVLASADVLVAILEPEAGAFSVPSKVLSYLCAGRPILAALPRANRAARVVESAGAGLVVEPRDRRGFVAAAARLARDAAWRDALGASARRFAERTFAIAPIAAGFEELCAELAGAAGTAETARYSTRAR